MSYTCIPFDHPLRKSNWLWPEGDLYLYNSYAHFRHDFELKTIPEFAPLYITADQSYRLYINGTYVCRGPARGYQSHWPFDEVEVKRFLRTGHNWLAVEAYNPGVGNFQYFHMARAGFLCAAEWDDIVINTDIATWQMRRSHGQRSDIARLSIQMAFQEDATITAADREWITSATRPSWPGTRFPPIGEQFPFGQPPWDNVEPRDIPMLREAIIVPVAVTSQGIGICKEGYRDCKNISWHWIAQEADSVTKWESEDRVDFRQTAGALEIEVQPVGSGKLRAITFDIGEISLGSLNVNVAGATGNEIIDFQYHQCLRDGIPVHIAVGEACQLALATRLRPAAGTCYHEFYPLFGARHITIIARDVTQPLTLMLSWRSACYPFTMRGRFDCSDPVLNQIHEICRHTQQVCAYDAYVDTPWREQAQWWGDARVQARNTFYLDGDARLLARGIRSIAGQSAPHGLTYAHAPTCNGGCILPDFSLTWILTIWDYYWQTGDLSIFHEQHERIKQILAYFELPEACNADGLLIYDKRFWLFEDWAELPKSPIPTFLNLWHLYTLEHYARLLEAAQEPAESVRKKIVVRRQLLCDRFFDRSQGLFLAGLDNAGLPLSVPSVHDQVLAILLELQPEAWKNMLDLRLLPFLRQKNVPGATPSAFWVTYLFDVMKQLGYRQETVAFIRRRWAPMISTGATWEEFKWTETATQSCSHAWSAHPSSHLVNILAGLRQTAPAWSAADWNPIVSDDLDHASAVIPTPKGTLSASWKKMDGEITFHIEIPEGMTVRVQLPKEPEQDLQSGIYNFVMKTMSNSQYLIVGVA